MPPEVSEVLNLAFRDDSLSNIVELRVVRRHPDFSCAKSRVLGVYSKKSRLRLNSSRLLFIVKRSNFYSNSMFEDFLDALTKARVICNFKIV
jgi:hypothetical protein